MKTNYDAADDILVLHLSDKPVAMVSTRLTSPSLFRHQSRWRELPAATRLATHSAVPKLISSR